MTPCRVAAVNDKMITLHTGEMGCSSVQVASAVIAQYLSPPACPGGFPRGAGEWNTRTNPICV